MELDQFVRFIRSRNTHMPEYTLYDGSPLTEKDALVADFFMKRVVPSLKSVFMKVNYSMYVMWKKNCCRQVALVCRELLEEFYPEYIWKAYEGMFCDMRFGPYEHAFVVGHGHNDLLFVDLSRQEHPNVFRHIQSIHEAYKGLPTYEPVLFESYTEMPIEEYMQAPEYYTSWSARTLIDYVRKDCLTNELRVDLELYEKHNITHIVQQI